MGKTDSSFMPVSVAVLTVSDHRDARNDTSGDYFRLVSREAGHQVVESHIVPDNKYAIREIVSRWIAGNSVQVVLVNGGTGFNAKNSTPEALQPLFDRDIAGFGEAFRRLSWDDIGTSTLQSRALAGMANGTLIFAVPGSTGACRLAWEELIAPQLDARTRPCQFVPHLKSVE
ncbi:molybdenum cofactor biosynthesis protein B [Photobacterium sp. R1]